MLPRVSLNQKTIYPSIKRDLSHPTFTPPVIKEELSFGTSIISYFKIRKEVKKQEEIAKDLGVKAKYGIHLKQAKEINKALILAQKKGYLLPHNIICTEKVFKTTTGGGKILWGSKKLNSMKKEQIIEYFANQRDKIKVFIRPIIPDQTMQLVNTNLSPIIFVTLHEIGHYNHRISCAEVKDVDSMSFANVHIGNFKNAAYILKETGSHSLSNGEEFIANAFAKIVGNEKISEKVMNRYNFWTCGLLKPYYWQK